MLRRHQIKVLGILRAHGIPDVEALDITKEIHTATLDVESDAERLSFKGFSLSQVVIVAKTLKGAIIGYDGRPEGFPPELIGCEGVIIGFDKTTMSSKNVLVEFGDIPVWGNIECLKSEAG